MSFGRKIRTRVRDNVWSLPHHNSLTYKPAQTFQARLRTLAIYAPGIRRMANEHRLLRPLTEMKNAFKGPALVVGAGPSAGSLEKRHLEYLNSVGITTFALNGFSRIVGDWPMPPDNVVVADPLYFTVAETGSNSSTLNSAQVSVGSDLEALANYQGNVFIPVQKSTKSLVIPGQVVYFNFAGLEGMSKNIDPTRARGYSGVTLMAALSLALHLGHSPVMLIGVDYNFPRYLHVDPLNRLMMEPYHAYKHEPEFWGNNNVSVPDFLADMAQCIQDFSLFSGHDVINLGGDDSLIDTFPRACLWAPQSRG